MRKIVDKREKKTVNEKEKGQNRKKNTVEKKIMKKSLLNTKGKSSSATKRGKEGRFSGKVGALSGQRNTEGAGSGRIICKEGYHAYP